MTATDTGAQMERLEETALREGAEELGLDAACIVCLADLGESQMTSVQTGKPKRLHLFAAELSAEPLLLPHAPTTAACRWMTLTEFAAHGRPDHLPLVERALRRLA